MISDELMVRPFEGGVQLIAPSESSSPLQTMKEIFQFPINVFFQHPNGTIIHYNEHTFQTIRGKELGYYSHRDLAGKTLEKYLTQESANNYINNDKNVIRSGRMMILEEEGVLHNNLILSAISFKFPCYLDKDKPPFIFGLAIIPDKTVSASGISLVEGLQYIFNLGLFPLSLSSLKKSQFKFQREIDGVYITKQQFECLKYAMQGMTAKKIANKLGISFRTVESHFEILKYNLNVESKSALIEKVINHQSKIL